MSAAAFLRRAALGVALAGIAAGSARAADPALPDWSGVWMRVGGSQFDPSRPAALAQEAPLTADYQARFLDLLAHPPADGIDNSPTALCMPSGMPRAMIAEMPMEIVTKPGMVYVMLSYLGGFRYIFTDGRGFPSEPNPQFYGTSIGHWEGATLLVETRGFDGPRSFDASGLPLHDDNETVVTERISLDAADPDLLHDEITTRDHALTRPWTVTRSYRRARDAAMPEHVCAEEHQRIAVGSEIYAIEGGRLAPVRPGQPPPDLRNFADAPPAGK